MLPLANAWNAARSKAFMPSYMAYRSCVHKISSCNITYVVLSEYVGVGVDEKASRANVVLLNFAEKSTVAMLQQQGECGK